MSELVAVYGVLAVLLGGLALLAVSAPRQIGPKLAGLALTGAALVTSYGGLTSLMSLPKPASFEWWRAPAEQAVVLASELREQQGIYLWLQLPGVAEPRAYRLPWDRELAEQLQAARRTADGNGGQVRMRGPFESSLDDRAPKFYAPPPAAPPDKHQRTTAALQVSQGAAR